jgi:uncharacterized glyoxalase superfamily protein PhnB
MVMPLLNEFFGERMSMLRDPFRHEWLPGGYLESVTREDMQSRYTTTSVK